jgi:hypothetical protein
MRSTRERAGTGTSGLSHIESAHVARDMDFWLDRAWIIALY